jgi:hypothetical protein
MKQLEHSMKTNTVYLEMFNMCSISSSADINIIFKLFPCTSQQWLINEFALVIGALLAADMLQSMLPRNAALSCFKIVCVTVLKVS